MRVARDIAPLLATDACGFPIVTILGPRQSGKTTLAKQCFPEKAYANLEELDIRERAARDPRAFLQRFPDGAVLDEIQRVPELASYLQADVDRHDVPGRWVLTGSHQPRLRETLGQSLAGRTSLATLLPFSLGELARMGKRFDLDALLVAGFYPRLHHEGLRLRAHHESYVGTYLERDVRQLVKVVDLDRFQRFLGLAAGRTGQLANYASLAAEVGVDQTTAKQWYAVLDASFVATRLTPWFANVGKRLIKSPKLFLYDVGIAAWLMGVAAPSHLAAHPLRGALFETLVVMEAVKLVRHHGAAAQLHFYRDSQGREVDLVVETGAGTLAVEIKSGMTVASDWFAGLERFAGLEPARVRRRMIVYGGTDEEEHRGVDLVPWWRFPVRLLNWLAEVEALAGPIEPGALADDLMASYGPG